jgi:F420-non-reducing hydrogenase iron-sulfur subunit
MFRELCDFVGIDINRVQFSWVSAAEGARWAEVVNTTVTKIRELGPYTEYKKVADYPVKEASNG